MSIHSGCTPAYPWCLKVNQTEECLPSRILSSSWGETDYQQVTQSINKILSGDDKCYKAIKSGAKTKSNENTPFIVKQLYSNKDVKKKKKQ